MRLFSGFWKNSINRFLWKFGFIKMPSGMGGFASGGIWGFSSLGSRKKQLAAYQNHIYKCVTLIYRRCVSVPMKLYKERDDENEEINRHPFIDLMKKPNPYMTGRLLKAVTTMHLDLTGMAFWLKVFNSLGRPAEIWPLPVGQFSRFVFNDALTELMAYEFMAEQGGMVTFRPEEIVYFRYPHPLYFFEGASPVQAMAFAYDTDFAIRKYQRNFFQNSARPDVTLQTDQNIQPEDAKRLLLGWKQAHQGVDNAWEPALLDKGLKAEILSVSAKDFEFAALSSWTKEDILEAYGIPEGKLGSVKDVNRANGLEIDITFNSECISPRLDLYEEVVTNEVLSHYDTGLFAKHVSCIPRDLEHDLKERETNLKSKLTTVNEERAREGMKPVPWGDAPWVMISEIQYGEEAGIKRESATDPHRETQTESSKLKAEGEKGARDNFRLGHERRVAARSRAYRGYLRRFFKSLKEQVLNNLEERFPRVEGILAGMSLKKVKKWIQENKGVVDEINFDMNRANKDLIEGSGPYYEASLIDGAETALTYVGAVDVVFDLYDPRVIAFLKEKEIILRDVNRVTYDAIRAQLIEGFESGETMNQIAARIRDVFKGADEVRSLRIAQTETNSAANRGSFEGYRQSGVVEGKEWLAGPDARDTHQAAAARYRGDGAIPLDQDFEVGAGRGPAPGNIGLAAEDINCRCAILPVLRKQ